MSGYLLGYGVARSPARSRARRAARPDGYEAFEFMVLLSALVVGAGWPVHLGSVPTRWGVHVAASIVIATIAGVIGLATGVGYVIIAIVYSGIWLAVLINRGTRAEQQCEHDGSWDKGEDHR